MTRREFLTGNQAMAEAAIVSGLKVFVGYPITPASDLFEYLSEKLPKYGGVVFQAEDEIASINALVGAVYAGAKAMTATSGPGFSLMVESLGLAAMLEAPIVIVYDMRAGPSTGIATGTGQGDVMQSRWGSHGIYMDVVYAPWSVQEAYTLTIKAFDTAWRLRVPTIVLSDAVLAHTRELVIVHEPGEIKVFDRKKPKEPPGVFKPFKPDPEDLVPPMAFYGEGYAVFAESLSHDERGYYTTDKKVYESLVRRLVDKVERNRKLVVESASYYVEDAETLIVAFGSLARNVLALVKDLRREGKKVGMWRPKSLWPLDTDGLLRAAEGVKQVIVVEMNYGQLYLEVSRILGPTGKEVRLVPILYPELPSPEEIYEKMKEEGVKI
ncbi:MAG: 2-oxoacid:acceptor oxidoreductase subunit alpha [Pyrodictiaceae archaeon]